MTNIVKFTGKKSGKPIQIPPTVEIKQDGSIIVSGGTFHGVAMEGAMRLSLKHAINILYKELSRI